MKNATEKIIENFPNLEKYLVNESVLPTDETLSNLSDVEEVFLRLAWFFESPETEKYNLENFYKYLEDEWLELGLEAIHLFFTNDTHLIKRPNPPIITDGDYMNQSKFAEFLSQNGLNYDKAKLSVYIQRGKAPKDDITISIFRRATAKK